MSEEVWNVRKALPTEFKLRLERLSGSEVPPAAYLAAFMELIRSLKSTGRTGWINCQVPNPEHIGDHMYRMAILCMFTKDPNLDYKKCVQIALVHDIAECVVGDITPIDMTVDSKEKHRRELETILYIRDLIMNFNPEVAHLIYDLWNEYENQTSPEAKLVKDVDKLELLYQAKEYERQYPAINFNQFRHVGGMVKTPEAKEWVKGAEYYYQ